jgi:hypothetical protein
VSGLCVVDIDPRDGGALDPATMTPTACVVTGGGLHLYYHHPGGRTVGKLGPGVDIKADGGYVAAPPSIHPDTDQPYRWTARRTVAEMAPALRAAIRPVEPVAPVVVAAQLRDRTTGTAQSAGAISHPEAMLAACIAAVDRAPVGRRRRTL